MTTGRFDITRLPGEVLDAVELVYRVARGITAYRDASLYDESDVQAAWDIIHGIEYLRMPIEWTTQTHHKEPYKQWERNS